MRSRFPGIGAALLVSGPAVCAQSLPEGWHARAQDGGTLYQPGDLPAGRRFELWMSPPVAVAGSGLDAWSALYRRDGVRGLDLDAPPRCDAAALEPRGIVRQRCSVPRGARPGMHLQFFMLPSGAGQVRWGRVA